MLSNNFSLPNRPVSKTIQPKSFISGSSLPKKASSTGHQILFGNPTQNNNRGGGFPFTKKEMLFGILYLLGTFTGISRVITGSWALADLKPHQFEGHSGWPQNTVVLAPGGQDVYHLISNKWGGKNQRYIDNFVAQMSDPSTQSITEAHALLSESGFRNFYLQHIYPTASSDLPLEMIDGQLQPGRCLDTFKKSDDPTTQHVILIEGKGASLQKVDHMLREQFPLMPSQQITVLQNPTKEQLQQSLSRIREMMAHQLQDPHKKTPQLLLYYQGHGGIFNKTDKHASEGSYLGAVLLGNGPADEKWFAEEMSKFPDKIDKTLIFESCRGGSFIKV